MTLWVARCYLVLASQRQRSQVKSIRMINNKRIYAIWITNQVKSIHKQQTFNHTQDHTAAYRMCSGEASSGGSRVGGNDLT